MVSKIESLNVTFRFVTTIAYPCAELCFFRMFYEKKIRAGIFCLSNLKKL